MDGGKEENNRVPVVFETRHRARFREIDSYGHMNMTNYVVYYADHRFQGMAEFVGLDFKAIAALPVAFHIRSFAVEYLRPIEADQEFFIRSFVSELGRSLCHVEFAMIDAKTGAELSTARMKIGCVVKATGKLGGWPPGLMERFFK